MLSFTMLCFKGMRLEDNYVPTFWLLLWVWGSGFRV